MTEERKHAILLATVILTARKLQPLLEEDDQEGKPNVGTEFWTETYIKKSMERAAHILGPDRREVAIVSPFCPFGRWYTSRMRKKKQSFELTFEQTEMLGKFGGASFDYPKLSFEEVARKLLGPKPFKAITKGKQFKKVCREAFDRERE